MSLLQNVTQKTINEWMEENHPLVHTASCLNKKQRKFVCTTCKDICPSGVHNSDVRDWSECENCNLCVAACPSQAISPSLSVLKGFLGLLDLEQDTVIIGCRHNTDHADLQVDCLATVPWEMVARLALDKTLVMDTSDCGLCGDANKRDQMWASLTRAEIFLSPDYFGQHVRLNRKGTPPGGVSRREAFSAVFNMFRKTVATLLPGEEVESRAHSALYRKILAARLRKMPEEGPQLTVTWETPVFSENCVACPVCERICVHNAIKVVDDADGTNTRHMLHYGYKCVHCGLCETLCPEHAIVDWTLYSPGDPFDPASTTVTAKEEPAAPRPFLASSLGKNR